MASWMHLYQFLFEEDMTAHDVAINLGVPPSRVRRLLKSKRLASRLENIKRIAAMRSAHTLCAGADLAARKLASLQSCDSHEIVRKVCLEILQRADRQQRKGEGLADGLADAPKPLDARA
jgi:predicted transcriptional regulator